MSIYNVPVADTKFFPVSGDMMALMTTDKKNDTGDSAKNPSDAVYSITPKGKQAMLLTSSVHQDLEPHPVWCDPNMCIPADPTLRDDRRLHQGIIGRVAAYEGTDLQVDMVTFDDRAPTLIVGDTELDATGVNDLILLLAHARQELKYAGGEG